jgi:hypothetical protein
MKSLGRLTIGFALPALVIGIATLNAAADDPPAKSEFDNPNSPGYRIPSESPVRGPERDALAASIKEKLDAHKPHSGKKEANDFFVVGTIALQNHHAVVDFLIKQGLQPAADSVADFVLGKADGEIREYRIFGRAKNLKAAEVIRAKAKSDSIEDQLIAFKRTTPGKKTLDDYFVVGTADLNSRTLHADIRFEVLGGVKATADFLIDFIFNSAKDHKGEWHVFFRGRTEAQATDYRQQMRQWYDSQEAQRSQIAAIYKAKTTARC